MNALLQAGWEVQRASAPQSLPAFFLARFDWLPISVQDFLTHVDSAVSSDQKAWFITRKEIAGESDSAFAWDEWEFLSLETAEDDPDWQNAIIAFWDEHCPLVLSVKNGYSHLSMRRDNLAIVAGNEPEFEEVEVVAESWEQLLEKVATNDPSLSLYI
ncbi:SMI1/KNR4 family protein [Blastopirellula marina]|uniref:SMI1/KNR4 family protein n=1 Tax=Blastopirellula marina TaxID=124 RepID=A0A2S8GLQ5_9BACT|nr:SMI1/KNR4 family protein [Blastopirellula marina]PQO45251.1 SMI1/KNR4 family protein [Blastopirellula marina]